MYADLTGDAAGFATVVGWGAVEPFGANEEVNDGAVVAGVETPPIFIAAGFCRVFKKEL